VNSGQKNQITAHRPPTTALGAISEHKPQKGERFLFAGFSKIVSDWKKSEEI
jgi:hypothetical protein